MGSRIFLAMALMSSPVYSADKAECLARIAYAESRGTAVDGVVAVMHASLSHSKKLGTHVCSIPAKQLPVPVNLSAVYRLIAHGVISGSIPDLSNGADSWNNSLPKRGRITRKIGANYFTVAMR